MGPLNDATAVELTSTDFFFIDHFKASMLCGSSEDLLVIHPSNGFPR